MKWEINISQVEYKQCIYELQNSLSNVGLEWTSNTKAHGELLPNFRVTRIYAHGNLNVNAKVSVQACEKGEGLKLSIQSQGRILDASDVLEAVESGLEGDKNRQLDNMEGYVAVTLP